MNQSTHDQYPGCRSSLRLSLVAVFSVFICTGAAAEISDSSLEALDRAAAQEMATHALPGIQVAIANANGVVFAKGYGLADVENHVPVTQRTMYRTASISKWLTATAAMRLVELGQLDLDEPIQTYCPAYPKKRWAITAHHLLSHTAGIRNYIWYERDIENAVTNAQRAELDERYTRERLGMITPYEDVITPLENFSRDPLDYQPGTNYAYTSFGYRVLACVMDGASGTPYRKLISELILEPAGLDNIVEDDALGIIPWRAGAYTIDDAGRLQRDRFRDISENLPAGGHLATASNLARFAIAFNAGLYISEESRERMASRPAMKNDSDTTSDSGYYYGYGINVRDWNGHRQFTHRGGQSGTSTILTLLPERGVAVAVMTNQAEWSGTAKEAFAEKLLEIYLSEM